MEPIPDSLKHYRKLLHLCETNKLHFFQIVWNTSPHEIVKNIIQLGKQKNVETDDIAILIANGYEDIELKTNSDNQFITRFLFLVHLYGYTPGIMLFFDKNYDNAYYLASNETILSEHITTICNKLSFQSKISFFIKKTNTLLQTVKLRLYDAEEFYCRKNLCKIKQLMGRFSDEISKISFKTFLKQRIHAHICYGKKAMYPILPPRETEQWRQEQNQRPIRTPILLGAKEYLVQFMIKDTFILEQYAISGTVEAHSGDTVIDAGAFIGDTALYFSQKVGNRGHIYAFEPIPETVKAANANLKNNPHEATVEIIPMALSDKKQHIQFNIHEVASNSYAFGSEQLTENNTSFVSNSTCHDNVIQVMATSLDEFVHERHLHHIDFIKSDLQGADMDFLHGAKGTISRDGPTCGLTLYHKQADFLLIPEFLDSLRDDWVFYFRCETEPVLFAITKDRLCGAEKRNTP